MSTFLSFLSSTFSSFVFVLVFQGFFLFAFIVYLPQQVVLKNVAQPFLVVFVVTLPPMSFPHLPFQVGMINEERTLMATSRQTTRNGWATFFSTTRCGRSKYFLVRFFVLSSRTCTFIVLL